MLSPLVEATPALDGQSLRVLLWDRDLVDMHCLDARGARRPYRGRGSQWHCHAEVELTLVTRGAGVLAIGDHLGAFTGPDLVLVGAHVPHVWKPRGPTAGIAVQLRADAAAALAALPEFAGLRRLLGRARQGLRVRGATADLVRAELATLEHAPALRRLARVLGMLDALASAPARDAQPLSTKPLVMEHLDRRSAAMDRVVAHLMDRYRDDDLRLADVVRMSGRSPATFGRHFARVTGKTFVGFITALRLQEVRRALAETDRTVAAIAFAAGFRSLAQFYAVFRRDVGCSPTAYRRARRSSDEALRPASNRSR